MNVGTKDQIVDIPFVWQIISAESQNTSISSILRVKAASSRLKHASYS